MAKQKIIAGHLDHKHGYYYMVLSLPNPEKGNRKLPKWFPTGIPYDGKRQTERDAKRMLKEWREDFTSGKLTLAMIDAKKRSKGTDGAMSLKSIPIRKDPAVQCCGLRCCTKGGQLCCSICRHR